MTLVEAHRHTVGVAPLLAAIGEPMSTFYHRTSRVPSVRAVADAVVAERIEEIWQQSRRSYGAPRIHAMLAREGIRVGRKRVERLMRGLGIQGAHLHKHWKTTRPDRRVTAAPDLVERQFQAAAPNTLWVADLTYIKTLQGILYLAVVLDVCSPAGQGVASSNLASPTVKSLPFPLVQSLGVRICCGRRGCSGLAALGLAVRVLAAAASVMSGTYGFASSRTLIRDLGAQRMSRT